MPVYRNPKPKSHAAYVTVNGKRQGHVYMTVEIDGDTMVLDPSLASGHQLTLASTSQCTMLKMCLVTAQLEQPFTPQLIWACKQTHFWMI